MHASIITTVRHNIGDDFVREGIISILRDVVNVDNIELIHKHSPITAVYGFEKARKYRISVIVDPMLRVIGVPNRISDADLLIQSGAPVYWCHSDGPHCADNEWYDPLVRKRFLKDRRGRKFFNLAGGSCQRYHSDGSEIATCSKCKSYIAEFFDACDLTILRDRLAKEILNIAGRDAEVLPCTSIFARDYLDIAPMKGKYIVVNFMENAGHYTFGQSINSVKWRQNFALLVKKLQSHGRVIAACHTLSEEAQIKDVMSDIETYVVPDEHVKYMEFYASARFAVVNRVHAGFMIASFGKPVTVIGNDSRALMIENLNLKSYFVDEVDEILIDEIIDGLLSREKSYHDEVEQIRLNSRRRYIDKISGALNSES